MGFVSHLHVTRFSPLGDLNTRWWPKYLMWMQEKSAIILLSICSWERGVTRCGKKTKEKSNGFQWIDGSKQWLIDMTMTDVRSSERIDKFLDMFRSVAMMLIDPETRIQRSRRREMALINPQRRAFLACYGCNSAKNHPVLSSCIKRSKIRMGRFSDLLWSVDFQTSEMKFSSIIWYDSTSLVEILTRRTLASGPRCHRWRDSINPVKWLF